MLGNPQKGKDTLEKRVSVELLDLFPSLSNSIHLYGKPVECQLATRHVLLTQAGHATEDVILTFILSMFASIFSCSTSFLAWAMLAVLLLAIGELDGVFRHSGQFSRPEAHWQIWLAWLRRLG